MSVQFNERRAINFHRIRNELNMKTVEVAHADRSTLFTTGFSGKLTDALIKRNTHAILNSLLVVKIQFMKSALWLIHTGEAYNPNRTVMNAIPVVYDAFQEKLVFSQLGQGKYFLQELSVDSPYYVRVMLVRNAKLSLGSIFSLPQDIMDTSVEGNATFFSDDLFGSPYLDYLMNRTIYNPVAMKLSASSILLNLTTKQVAEEFGDTIFRTTRTFMATVQTSERAGHFFRPEIAFEPPLVGYVSGATIVAKSRIENSPIPVMKGSAFESSVVDAVIANACKALRSLGIGATTIDHDVAVVYEALLDAVFVHECIFGPLRGLADVTYAYEVPLYENEEYRTHVFDKHVAWITATKILMRHSCRTARVFGFFKGIFDAVSSLYPLFVSPATGTAATSTGLGSTATASSSSTAGGPSFSDRHALRKAVFAALFWDPVAIASHRAYLDYPHILTDVPMVFPSLFHIGFYVVHQMAEYLTTNAKALSGDISIALPFPGFADMPLDRHLWAVSTLGGTDELRELIAASVPLREDDWSAIDEALIDAPSPPTMESAILGSAPTVTFGNTKLLLEGLGDAMRRLFLGAFPDNYFGEAQGAYTDELLQNFKNGPVGSIARVLLQLRSLVKSSSKVMRVRKAVADAAFPKIGLVNPDPDKRTSQILGAPYITMVSNFLGNVFEGRALYVIAKLLAKPVPPRVSADNTVLAFARRSSAHLADRAGIKRPSRASSLEPRSPAEKMLLDDVLLVTWFLQSPLFTRAPYMHWPKVTQGDTSFSSKRLYYGALFQISTTPLNAHKIKDLTFESYGNYVNGIVNTRQHGLLSLSTAPTRPIDRENMLFKRKHSSRGELIVNPHDLRGFSNLYDVEGVSSLNVLFPRSKVAYSDYVNYSAGVSFFETVDRFVITATCRKRAPMDAGLQTRRLFDTESPHFVDPSHARLLSTDDYLSWTVLREALDRMYAKNYIVANDGSMAPYAGEETTRRFASTHAISENRVLLYDYRRAEVASRNVMASFRATAKGQLAPFLEHFIFDRIKRDRTMTETITDVRDEYLREVFSVPMPKFSKLHQLVTPPSFSSSSLFNQNEVTVAMRRTPASTFAFYEAVKLTMDDLPVTSPLEVFRMVSQFGLSAGIDEKVLADRANFPPAKPPVPGKKVGKDSEPSYRACWAPNEFYGEIAGYVCRGRDHIALFEENARGNDVFSFASSSTMRSPHALPKGDVETGLVPIYDTCVSLSLPSSSSSSSSSSSTRVEDDYRIPSSVTVRARTGGDARTGTGGNVGGLKWKYGQWVGLTLPPFNGLTRCVQDLIRKQWALYPALHFVPGNVIGVLAGEVSAMEMIAESVDVFDPGMPVEGHTDLEIKALDFSAVTRDHAESVFSLTTLYPVGEFEWFQYTGVERRSSVPYTASKADASTKFKVYRLGKSAAEATPAVIAAFGPHTYRERIAIKGYQISGARFSSRVRHVRYTENPLLANAVFTEVPRTGLAAYGDEPSLSYWALTATKPILNDVEIVCLMPSNLSSTYWRKFLLSGYPKAHAGIFDQGYAWGMPIKLCPNYRTSAFGKLNQHFSTLDVSSPLPVVAPRLLTMAQELVLYTLSQRPSSAALTGTPVSDYVDGLVKFDLSPALSDTTALVRKKIAELVPLDKSRVLFPNRLVTVYGVDGLQTFTDEIDFDYFIPQQPSSSSSSSSSSEEFSVSPLPMTPFDFVDPLAGLVNDDDSEVFSATTTPTSDDLVEESEENEESSDSTGTNTGAQGEDFVTDDEPLSTYVGGSSFTEDNPSWTRSRRRQL